MTPPKAPPAPPNASEMKHTVTAHAAHAAPVDVAPKAYTTPEKLVILAKRLDVIAKAVPTPNVTDSEIHGAALSQIAEELRKIANG